jgi:hypothetical protein
VDRRGAARSLRQVGYDLSCQVMPPSGAPGSFCAF